MKNKKILSAILVAITALTCSANNVSSEETTEAFTEAVTEAASEITTEIPAETTAPVTTDIQEEITSVTTRTFILFEPEITPDRWTGGEYKRIIDLQPYISDTHSYGEFLGLYMGGDLVDSEYYTVVYDKDKSIAFTFNEKFRNKYGNRTCNFSVEFENMSLKNLFRFTITDPATQTESPKTGDNNAAILTAILGLSGITACIFKKRKDSLY